ncbi:MAG: nucleotidyltransferase domain-containing protein [Elusimicrobia bacterium]|nr:nucleotidyltransferase domain-containing protein [Elusimicrobiota bacterium]
MVSMREIRTFSRQIAEAYKPQRIILFGSYANGKPGPDSDVDLLVILPGREKDANKAVDIRLKLHPTFPLDLLVRTPLSVRRRIAMGDCFMKEILTKGKLLYEAHHA